MRSSNPLNPPPPPPPPPSPPPLPLLDPRANALSELFDVGTVPRLVILNAKSLSLINPNARSAIGSERTPGAGLVKDNKNPDRPPPPPPPPPRCRVPMAALASGRALRERYRHRRPPERRAVHGGVCGGDAGGAQRISCSRRRREPLQKGGADISFLHPDTHFSHMSHTPFPHISESNSIYRACSSSRRLPPRLSR